MGRKAKLLFVCIENSCRSQIAEGFAKQFGKALHQQDYCARQIR